MGIRPHTPVRPAAIPRRSNDRERAARRSCAPPASANDVQFPDFYETIARVAERADLKHYEIVTNTGAPPDAGGGLGIWLRFTR